jgi:hypothetical protein
MERERELRRREEDEERIKGIWEKREKIKKERGRGERERIGHFLASCQAKSWQKMVSKFSLMKPSFDLACMHNLFIFI